MAATTTTSTSTTNTSTTAAASDKQAVVADLDQKPVAVQWVQTIELGYTTDIGNNNAASRNKKPVCFGCSKIETTTTTTGKPLFQKCARCNVASYCSKECQIKDWKAVRKGGGGHKDACDSYARLDFVKVFVDHHDDHDDSSTNTTTVVQITTKNATAREIIRNQLFGRIRIYACAFAVHRTVTQRCLGAWCGCHESLAVAFLDVGGI
jgi:MYND finger